MIVLKKMSVVGGGLAAIGCVAYGIYLFGGFGDVVGKIVTVDGYKRCVQLAAAMPSSKEKVRAYLLDIDKSQTTNMDQGDPISSRTAGVSGQESGLIPEFHKCIAELRRSVKSADDRNL